MHADLDDLVIALYCFVDDVFGPRLGPGHPPKLSDAELVCLAIAQVLLGFPSERRWLRFANARLGHLFPYLPGQSGYNKRLRGAAELIRHAIRAMACDTTLWSDDVGDRLHPGGVWPLTGDRQALGAGRVGAVWLLR